MQTRLARQIASWAEQFERNSALARSPSWQRMMQGLSRFRQDGETPRLAGGGDSLLARWGIETPFGKLFSPENWTFRPELPRTDLPNLSKLIAAPGGSGSGRAAPTGLADLASASLWRGLFWLAFAGGGGVVFWWLFSGKNPLAAAQSAKGPAAVWSAGPWPVQPGQVTTREQLIQAFEHLTLLLLGKDARNWNHRQIADCLANEEAPPARQQAARELASFYESARYAPAAQAMPEADLAAARHHLCFLAGVPA